jgi:hypothetical protein
MASAVKVQRWRREVGLDGQVPLLGSEDFLSGLVGEGHFWKKFKKSQVSPLRDDLCRILGYMYSFCTGACNLGARVSMRFKK